MKSKVLMVFLVCVAVVMLTRLYYTWYIPQREYNQWIEYIATAQPGWWNHVKNAAAMELPEQVAKDLAVAIKKALTKEHLIYEKGWKEL
jgi:hypothetical protein